jgi:dolichol-phosphate mannosyltransferase
METDRLLVIIPTYAERGNLPTLLERLRAESPKAHVLIVDDASGDGTPEWVRQQAQFNQSLFLLERSGKKGLGTAYLEGFRWALERDYSFVAQMDADLSHDPAHLIRFETALKEGADLVLGSRYRDGVRVLNWPISRLLLSLGAALYVRWITRMPFTDPTSGFKAFRREALKKLDRSAITATGYGFQIEVTHWFWCHDFRISEVPIVFEGRHLGSSKMSGGIAREALGLVLRLALFSKKRDG